jgi:hypothetical protein
MARSGFVSISARGGRGGISRSGSGLAGRALALSSLSGGLAISKNAPGSAGGVACREDREDDP